MDFAISTALRYAGILLCVAFCAIFAIWYRNIPKTLLFFALVFTAVADWFLLVLEDYYEAGLAFFIIAQLFHFASLCLRSGKFFKINAITRLISCIILLITLYFFDALSPLTVLAAIYAVNLLANFACAIQIAVKDKRFWLLALGWLLFIGCDICVGLCNASLIGITISAQVYNFAGRAIWEFYFPSQVIISLFSIVKNSKENYNEK